MSFFGDLVNSIGTSRTPAPPKPVTRPQPTSSAAQTNPVQKPKVVPSPVLPPVTGTKRKFDERDVKSAKHLEGDAKPTKAPERIIRPNPAPGLSSKVNQRPSPIVPANGTKAAVSKPVPASTPGASTAPAKPAPKGSYAQILARAKEAQQTRAQNPLGTIKHQATSKEKISKLAERRRQEQEKLKVEKDKRSEKLTTTSRTDQRRGASPVKKNGQPKVPRAPRPPLHAPQSSYKGTMGQAAKKSRDERIPKKTRYDEYLATDEEDNSAEDGYGDEDDGYGYGSDASSEDMEAGLDDIDMEEKQALRHAMQDDAREAALESQLKKDKEDRKRRLQAMAAKRR